MAPPHLRCVLHTAASINSVAHLQRDAAAMEQGLSSITTSLQAMQALLSCMGERCDPYIYYKRVRVPMSGQELLGGTGPAGDARSEAARVLVA